MSSSKRNALLVVLGSAVAGYLFFRAESFWGVVSCALIAVWALVTMLPVMDAGWRLRVGFVTAVTALAALVLWPSVDGMTGGAARCPAYVKENVTFGLAKGLDLSGGLRLVYTVEVEEAIRDKRDRVADDVRLELATLLQIHSGDGRLTREEGEKLDAVVKVARPESALVRLTFTNAADLAKLDDRFRKKFQSELSETRGPAANQVTFKLRSEVESQIRDRAVAQAKETIVRRVDGLALREAAVTSRDEDIILEVPGSNQKAFDDIKEIIRKTARLEFKMVDDATDFFGRVHDNDIPENEGISIWQERAPNGPGKTVVTHSARVAKRDKETMNESLDRLKKWVATLDVPDDHQVGYSAWTDYDPDTGKTSDNGWRTYYLFSRTELTGDYITDAQVAQEQNQGIGRFYVSMTFSPAGGDRFGEVTGANIQRRFAIILDDVIDSAPVIHGKIDNGRAQITMGAGDPDQQLAQARKLELVLRSGALPAPITLSNESLIGPSLGQDAINQAVKGMLVSSSLVLLFMAFYYRKSGVVADLCVGLNLMLQLAILASFSATMTVPGIAALSLTIGIAVDVNVLINERIREELRAGRTVRAAVDAGYEKAFSSIVDGHVTLFISGLILAQYGTGPVKGFAINLLVGVLANLFTGVFCTRLVFDWWVRGAKVKRLSVGAEF